MKKTIVLKVDPDQPDADKISLAANFIRRGGLVAFPTETVYGLGADALNADAILRVFEA
jgi:L-threonylcarbamoyladenylate synthase